MNIATLLGAGNFNRRITITSWGSSQDEAGGNTATATSSYTIWAQVQNRSGGAIYSAQQQREWTYDYLITFRYEVSRKVNSNQTIDYDGKRLAIISLSYQDEGNRSYVMAKCSTIDNLA